MGNRGLCNWRRVSERCLLKAGSKNSTQKSISFLLFSLKIKDGKAQKSNEVLRVCLRSILNRLDGSPSVARCISDRREPPCGVSGSHTKGRNPPNLPILKPACFWFGTERGAYNAALAGIPSCDLVTNAVGMADEWTYFPRKTRLKLKECPHARGIDEWLPTLNIDNHC